MAGKKVDAKAKEKRQKMILAGGVVLLAVLMVVQLPKLMHRSSAATPPPAVATTNPDGSAAPAPVTPASLTPPSVNTSAAAVAATPSGLADTELAPVGQEGQLVHFDLFASKDPFVQQVKDLGPADAKPKSSASSSGGSSGGSTATPKAATTAVARISVDGTVEQVVAGGDFPLAAPVFHLESFGADSARISVVGGQYQDGRATLTLQKGKELTLENMTDATRYKVAFLGRDIVPTKDLDPALLGSTSTAATTTPALTPTVPTTTGATTTSPSTATTTTASN